MPESDNDPVIKTLGMWRVRRRPNGTHYAEDGLLVATTSEADRLFEIRTGWRRSRSGHPERDAMAVPMDVLGELLAEEIARGDHPDRAPGASPTTGSKGTS